MSLAENIVKEEGTRTPGRYRARVRWVALIYFVLNILSLGIIITIVWRVRYFVTLTQRSNVETLTLAIIFVLAVYYMITTFKGFIGAVRIGWYHLPFLFRRQDPNATTNEPLERRKHKALPQSSESKSAYFDQAVVIKGKPDEPISWVLEDRAGKLGELVIEGVKATYHPVKDGMSNSIFEFVAGQIEQIMQRTDKDARLQIAQWSTIDEDKAGAYFSMVTAFRNLEKRLGSDEPVWPTVEITQEDADKIGSRLRSLVPTLRDESLLPDLEYGVQYNVPILPEPLGFMRLTRTDNRADPVITMGCAGLIMLFAMILLTFVILFPPWIPGK